MAKTYSELLNGANTIKNETVAGANTATRVGTELVDIVEKIQQVDTDGLDLGTTSESAFRGDYGQAAYQHANTDGNPHNTVASEIGSTPEGGLSATTVQGAINELDSEKVGKTTKINGYSLNSDIDLSKSDVGLSNVDNTSDANKPISEATQNALSLKADLVGGKIPSTQLPAYVDDVLEYATFAGFPVTGESGKIYVALNTNLTYRWSGTAYVEISKSLALGETSDTAYRGDRGKTAYDHSQTTGNPHGTTAAQIPNVAAGSVAATTVQGAINELAGDIVQVETDLNGIKNITVTDNYVQVGGSYTLGVYRNYLTGIEYAGSYNTRVVDVNAGDFLKVTGSTRSNLTALMILFIGNTYVGYVNRGSGTSSMYTYTDYEFVVPPGVDKIAVTAENTGVIKVPLVYKKSGSSFNAYTKLQSDEKFALKSSSLKKYGIRWGLDQSESVCERLFDSVGLNAISEISGIVSGYSDFDNVYPWSDIKKCNLITLTTGAKKIVYSDESEFSETEYDVFVEIPKFYYERYIKDGYEHRIISNTGTTLHPAFIEKGKILDYIYISAYEGAYKNGTLSSVSGIHPANNEIPQKFLDDSKSKGDGYTLIDLRTIDAVQNLMWIEYANRNSNNVIGHGWSDLHQAVSTSWIAINNEIGNRLITNQNFVTNDKERLFIGEDIVIIEGAQQNILYNRKITSVLYDTPSIGTHTIEFDGSPVEIRAGMYFGAAPQTTGGANSMLYHTGRTNRAVVQVGSTIDRKRLNPCRYRFIENLVGNVWHFLPDVTFNNLTMYVSEDITDYEFGKLTDSYKPISTEFQEQSSNLDGFWVTGLSNDNFKKLVAFGKTFGNTGNENNFFGGFYYLSNGLKLTAHGGGFDHHLRTNIITYRAQINLDSRWYLYGCRLIYKPI